MLAACVFWASGLQSEVPGELGQYVSMPDSTFSWTRSTIDGHEAFQLVSQTWQGEPWRHDVVLVRPARQANLRAAIIEVTGWEPNETDYQYAKALADASGLTVALLFQIPNQPIGEREEDDLVAHTFEKYFETGDATWPLLFPMVKSVLRTMDMLEESTKRSDRPIDSFVITGASKRGWAVWLAAAVRDDRIIGVAPAVFDNLDFVAQLERQQLYWDAYSPMISDYTDRGLQDLLETERGKRLIQMVDPVSYLPAVSA
ncbi:MAG: phenylacetic acid degradation protein, partial [Armatimonadetes bacterium]|nr:phenylacetic acid degradation protein [Armatimonadota bacterium]